MMATAVMMTEPEGGALAESDFASEVSREGASGRRELIDPVRDYASDPRPFLDLLEPSGLFEEGEEPHIQWHWLWRPQRKMTPFVIS